jgi:hypothetical protein
MLMGFRTIRRPLLASALSVFCLIQSGPAGAQQHAGTPPDWLCVQVFVPSLSAATIWPGDPIDPYLKAWPDHPELAPLASRVVSRSVDDDTAIEEIDRFAQDLKDNRDETLPLLFAGVFDEANRARDKAVSGIRKFGRAQQDMLDRLREAVGQLDVVRAADPPDEERVRQLTEQLAWQRRIIDERHRSLAALCEQPGIVEGRVGRLARAIAGHLDAQ